MPNVRASSGMIGTTRGPKSLSRIRSRNKRTNAIVVATATRIIWTFNYADLIFVMTSGGPANATQITSTYTLLQAYANLDFGYAAALSVVLLLVMLAFTAAYLRLTRGVEEVG